MNALLASELLKLRTIRAPYVLALALLALSGLAVAGAVGADVLEQRERGLSIADAAEASQILVLLLGVLLVTNEYRHGTVAPTFLVTPARELVLAAKIVVAALAGLAAGAGVAAVAGAVALPWLSARGEPLALDGDLASAALRLVVVFVLSAALGVAIGASIRSQVGAIVGAFAWFLIAEPIVSGIGFVLTGFDHDPFGPYLPGGALDAIVSPGGAALGVWAAVALSLVYLAALTAVGTLVMLRRDAG